MVKSESLLPKRVVGYIHEMGVRALDHLAETMDRPVSPPLSAEPLAAPSAVRALIDRWIAMTTEEKEEFVEKVAASVIEVVAASAALPFGLKLGKQAAKATKKVLKRKTKKLRKIAKRTVAGIADQRRRDDKKRKQKNEKSAVRKAEKSETPAKIRTRKRRPSRKGSAASE